MKKRRALSPIGYAIVVIILIGVGMIISAPMIVENHNKLNNNNDRQNYKSYENRSSEINMIELNSYIRNIENRLNSRIDDLERKQVSTTSSDNITNKYICSIEGQVDDNNTIVPLDNQNITSDQKFVFVCQYKR